MAVVVNSHTANVHTHVFRVDGGKGFFFAGKGVVDGGHGIFKICINRGKLFWIFCAGKFFIHKLKKNQKLIHLKVWFARLDLPNRLNVCFLNIDIDLSIFAAVDKPMSYQK